MTQPDPTRTTDISANVSAAARAAAERDAFCVCPLHLGPVCEGDTHTRECSQLWARLTARLERERTAARLAQEAELAQLLLDHHLGADTAGQYDAAGLCACGEAFYESGGTPAGALAANRRLLEAHAAHVAHAAVQ